MAGSSTCVRTMVYVTEDVLCSICRIFIHFCLKFYSFLSLIRRKLVILSNICLISTSSLVMMMLMHLGQQRREDKSFRQQGSRGQSMELAGDVIRRSGPSMTITKLQTYKVSSRERNCSVDDG